MNGRILDSFNAKYLDPDKFSQTFVPSSDFNKVIKNEPILIVGARGSGKTTLLKMLGNDILPFWEHEKAEDYRSNIKFEGVYVPADSVWANRIRILKEANISDDVSEEFAKAAFSTHVCLCTIEALERSLSYKIEKDSSLGNIIIDKLNLELKNIVEYLKLHIDNPSFQDIKHALRKRMRFLGEYVKSKAILGQLTHTDLQNDIAFINMDLDFTLESIFDSFDNVFNSKGIRWVVLLDEFEVAPESLQQDIISRLRSSSKKHIYKIALVPCGKHLDKSYTASSKNDYDVLQLWKRNFEQNIEFCKGMLASRFSITDPERIFGASDYVESNKIPNEILKKSFTELFKKDESFNNYLINKSIDLDSLFEESDSRDDNLRKISPDVIFRNLQKSSKGMGKRLDNLPGFYTGWNAIVKISEGNPRWIMSTISSLIEITGDINKKIPQSKQLKAINQTTKAFKSMIGTTAITDNMGISTNTSVIELIGILENYIRNQYVNNPFKSDPYGHFVIDNKVSNDIKNTIRIALNHGAVVSLDSDLSEDIWSFNALSNHRFRLSYLLAPVYKLPLRKGKKVNLSSVLDEKFKNESLKESMDKGKFTTNKIPKDQIGLDL